MWQGISECSFLASLMSQEERTELSDFDLLFRSLFSIMLWLMFRKKTGNSTADFSILFSRFCFFFISSLQIHFSSCLWWKRRISLSNVRYPETWVCLDTLSFQHEWYPNALLFYGNLILSQMRNTMEDSAEEEKDITHASLPHDLCIEFLDSRMCVQWICKVSSCLVTDVCFLVSQRVMWNFLILSLLKNLF